MAEVSGEDGKTEANGAGEQVVEGGEASVEQQEGDTTVEDVAQQKSPDRRGSNSPSPSISPRGAGSSSPRRYDRRSQSPIDRRSRSPSTGRRTPSPLAGRDPEENKIFVGGIPWKLDDRDVEDMFSPFGDILDSKVMVDRASGRSRGFAFVTFKNDESVDKAIREMHQTRLEGREISVKRARVLAPEPPPRRQRRPPPRRDYDNYRGGRDSYRDSRDYRDRDYRDRDYRDYRDRDYRDRDSRDYRDRDTRSYRDRDYRDRDYSESSRSSYRESGRDRYSPPRDRYRDEERRYESRDGFDDRKRTREYDNHDERPAKRRDVGY